MYVYLLSNNVSEFRQRLIGFSFLDRVSLDGKEAEFRGWELTNPKRAGRRSVKGFVLTCVRLPQRLSRSGNGWDDGLRTLSFWLVTNVLPFPVSYRKLEGFIPGVKNYVSWFHLVSFRKRLSGERSSV